VGGEKEVLKRGRTHTKITEEEGNKREEFYHEQRRQW
jgi:hypothetical protein